MNKELIYSDGTYLENNESWHVEDSPWKADKILKIIKKNGLKPATVCEIGCGAGEILNQLHGRMNGNVQFFGYEVSPQAYNMAVTRQKDRLSFVFRDLLQERTQFDLLLVIDIIEHIPDYYGFLSQIRNKAEYKIFHIPLDLSVQTLWRLKPILNGRRNVGHIHYFIKDTALAALTETGYTIVDYFYTAGMVEAPGKSFASKLLSWPRRLLFKVNEDFATRLLGGYSLMVLAK